MLKYHKAAIAIDFDIKFVVSNFAAAGFDGILNLFREEQRNRGKRKGKRCSRPAMIVK